LPVKQAQVSNAVGVARCLPRRMRQTLVRHKYQPKYQPLVRHKPVLSVEVATVRECGAEGMDTEGGAGPEGMDTEGESGCQAGPEGGAIYRDKAVSGRARGGC
jgi:hypothetical protein